MILQKLKAGGRRPPGRRRWRRRSSPCLPTSTMRSARRPRTPARSPVYEVERLVNEPTAAALAYGLDRRGRSQLIAVYDFGGGTFDISILEVGEGVVEVKATNGDTHLGGDNIDQRIIEWLARGVQERSGHRPHAGPDGDPAPQARLRRRRRSSSRAHSETEINLPFITADASGPEAPQRCRCRARSSSSSSTTSSQALDGPLPEALEDAGSRRASDIDEVVLVGGQTRMPAIQIGR